MVYNYIVNKAKLLALLMLLILPILAVFIFKTSKLEKNSQSQVAQVGSSISNELSNYYTFDEGSGNVTNDSNGSVSGTLNGGASFVAGKIGNYAISLDGSNDELRLSSDVLGIGTITISFWIKNLLGGTNEGIITNGSTNLYLQENYQRLIFVSDKYTSLVVPFSVSDNNSWVLITIIRNSDGNTSAYKNGVLVAGPSSSGVPEVGTTVTVIGSGPYFSYFNGSIDDLRIYKRALNSSEIIDLYNYSGPSQTSTPNPTPTPTITPTPTSTPIPTPSIVVTPTPTPTPTATPTVTPTPTPTPTILPVSGDIISNLYSSKRTINWSGHVGVPGGIPIRPTKCLATACLALQNASADYKNGTTDSASLIQNAIDSAPEDTYVQIPEGSFILSKPISFNDKKTIKNVTLRGSGTDKTILIPSGWTGITSGSNSFSAERTITSGSTKGSTSIVVSNASGIQVGSIISLYQTNDSDFYWSRWNNKDNHGQYLMVTAVNGNTISFEDPLIWDFTNNPRFKYSLYPIVRLVGIEDLSIKPNSSYGGTMINYAYGYGLWVKNVELSGGIGNSMINITMVLRSEIRDSYIHDSLSSSDGYGILTQGGWPNGSASTGLLVENNVFSGLRNAIVLEGDTGGVFAYNYAKNTRFDSWPNYNVPDFNANHGEHGMMDLWEGNYSTEFQSDGYHGSASHQTLFRNYLSGKNSDQNKTGNRIVVDLTRYSYYFNLVGNIFGSSSWAPTSYEMSGTPLYPQTQTIYRFGYPNMGNNGFCNNIGEYWYDSGCTTVFNASQGNAPGWIDTKVKSTLVRWGNFDYRNNTTKWDGSEISNGVNVPSSNSLPPSLYLSLKPSWFGNLIWPPIGPDISGMVNDIPAKYCYDRNQLPNCLVSSSVPTPSASDTTAPIISINTPVNNSTISNSVVISANVNDPVVNGQITSGIYSVQFKVDNLNLGQELTAEPYSGSWNTSGAINGLHILTAIAIDIAGNSQTSAPVSVSISNVVPTSAPSNPTPTPSSSAPPGSGPASGSGSSGSGVSGGGTGNSSAVSSVGTFTPTVAQKIVDRSCPSSKVVYKIVIHTEILNLTYGSKGSKVVELQNNLIQSGFLSAGNNTGYYGPLTKKAVEKYRLAPQSQILSNDCRNLTSNKIIFSKNLTLGSTGTDVKNLQIFLNNQGFIVSTIGTGSKGKESAFFGPATQKALIKFQEYYAKDILIPNGLTKGTGYFGPATIKKVNALQ